MPTLQQLLNDVDARYRNTFTTDQKVQWMNMVQRQIYQLVRHEASPYMFATVLDQSLYDIPLDCDVNGIESVMLENQSGDFDNIPYRRGEEDAGNQFYSLVERSLFLYPVPDQGGKTGFIYYKKNPKELNSNNLATIPDLTENFHELLIIGTLERIAGARKDAVMKNNYAADFQAMLDDYEFLNKNTDPEFLTPIDELPKIRRSW